MDLCLSAIASRSDSSSVFFARGPNGMCWPLRRWPLWSRTGSRSRAPGRKASSTFSLMASRSMPMVLRSSASRSVPAPPAGLVEDVAQAGLGAPVVETRQHAGGQGRGVLEHAQQEVFGADARMVQAAGLRLGGGHDPAGVVGESFEHRQSPRLSRPRPPAYFLWTACLVTSRWTAMSCHDQPWSRRVLHLERLQAVDEDPQAPSRRADPPRDHGCSHPRRAALSRSCCPN